MRHDRARGFGPTPQSKVVLDQRSSQGAIHPDPPVPAGRALLDRTGTSLFIAATRSLDICEFVPRWMQLPFSGCVHTHSTFPSEDQNSNLFQEGLGARSISRMYASTVSSDGRSSPNHHALVSISTVPHPIAGADWPATRVQIRKETIRGFISHRTCIDAPQESPDVSECPSIFRRVA